MIHEPEEFEILLDTFAWGLVARLTVERARRGAWPTGEWIDREVAEQAAVVAAQVPGTALQALLRTALGRTATIFLHTIIGATDTQTELLARQLRSEIVAASPVFRRN